MESNENEMKTGDEEATVDPEGEKMSDAEIQATTNTVMEKIEEGVLKEIGVLTAALNDLKKRIEPGAELDDDSRWAIEDRVRSVEDDLAKLNEKLKGIRGSK